MIPAQNTVPYTQTPWVTWSIIGLCVTEFLYQSTLSSAAFERFIVEYALVPARYTDGSFAAAQGLSRLDPTPFVTSMFMHGGLLHIASNLWTLWVFGPALEERLGRERFALLYMASGLAAGLVHFLFNFSSPVPTLGASGAIAGIIAAYARRFPYAWVNVLQPIGIVPIFFMMPALLFAALWFLSQIVQVAGSAMMPFNAGGIAWWAHIGGFVVGWFLLKRIGPAPDPMQDARDATRSLMWPWEAWMRWMTWWWRR